MRSLAPFALCLLAACGTAPAWPNLSAPPGQDAGAAPPALLPLGPILAQAAALSPADPTASVTARMAALDARATALRGPVIPPTEAARLAPPGQLQ